MIDFVSLLYARCNRVICVAYRVFSHVNFYCTVYYLCDNASSIPVIERLQTGVVSISSLVWNVDET